jgi:hypothetical protein
VKFVLIICPLLLAQRGGGVLYPTASSTDDDDDAKRKDEENAISPDLVNSSKSLHATPRLRPSVPLRFNR